MKNWLKKNKFPITAFLVWRTYLQIMNWIIISLKTPLNPTFPYYLSDLGQYPRLQAVFGFFDGVLYMRIAASGYVEKGLQAFFPIYPALIRLLQQVTNDYLLSGVLISNISALIALIILWNTIEKKLAKKAIILILLFPTSYYLASVYTESLFLLSMSTWLYAMKKKNYWLAALASGAASATRLVGVTFAVGLFISILQDKKFNQSIKNFLTAATQLLVSVSGLFAYMIYLWRNFGDAMMFRTVQPLFGASRSGDKIILLPQVLWRYAKILVTVKPDSLLYFRSVAELLSFSVAAYLLYYVWKRGVIYESVMVTLALLIPTLTGTLLSMPRFFLVLVPLFIVLAQIIKKKKAFTFLVVTFFLLQILTFYIFSTGSFIS